MTSGKRISLTEALLTIAEATGFEPEREAVLPDSYVHLSGYLAGAVTTEADPSWRLASTYRSATRSAALVDLAL